jgi:hypothetical protein
VNEFHSRQAYANGGYRARPNVAAQAERAVPRKGYACTPFRPHRPGRRAPATPGPAGFAGFVVAEPRLDVAGACRPGQWRREQSTGSGRESLEGHGRPDRVRFEH